MSGYSQPITEAGQEQVTQPVVDEALVEEIWQSVQGRASDVYIRQLVLEAVSEFADATITTYISIFVRRQVLQQLATLPLSNDPDAVCANPCARGEGANVDDVATEVVAVDRD